MWRFTAFAQVCAQAFGRSNWLRHFVPFGHRFSPPAVGFHPDSRSFLWEWVRVGFRNTEQQAPRHTRP